MPNGFEHICYKRNFLQRVIARLDFLAPFPRANEPLPTELTQEILRRFPIAEPKQAFAQEFEVAVATQELKTHRTEFTEWRFFGRNREKQLTLQPGVLGGKQFTLQHGFLWIEVKQYERYETLREEFLAVCTAFFRSFPDAPQPSRLGLRYINVFERLGEDMPLTDWSGFFHPSLLEAFKFAPPEDCGMLSRVFHNMEFAFDECSLRFQFGMNNPDYPARMRRKSFVLDYDSYFQGAIDQSAIGDLLDRFHGKTQQYFERSIGDKTREVLNA